MSNATESESVDLPSVIEGTYFDSGKTFRFADTARLKEWAQREIEFWTDLKLGRKPPGSPIVADWSASQIDSMRTLKSNAESIEKLKPGASNYRSELTNLANALNGPFTQLRDGRLLSREHPIAIRMMEIAKRSPESAWGFRALAHPDIESLVSNHNIRIPFLIRAAIDAGASADLLANATAEQGQLDELHNDARKTLKEIDEARVEARDNTNEFWSEAENVEATRAEAWKKRLEDVDKDWGAKIDVFNNHLALQAPSLYWEKKAKEHQKAATGFAKSFAAALAIGLLGFSIGSLPILAQLQGNATEKTIVGTLTPIIVFAFAAIWVLRILGRQLSRHIQLRDDARERQTMVLTFLALMNEKDAGRLVTDNDRILILHALFRPSSTHAPDDAPPAHWFDLLTSKIGDKPN